MNENPQESPNLDSAFKKRLEELCGKGIISEEVITALEDGRLIHEPGRIYNLHLQGSKITADSRFNEEAAAAHELLEKELGLGHSMTHYGNRETIGEDYSTLPSVYALSSGMHDIRGQRMNTSMIALHNVRLSNETEDRMSKILGEPIVDSLVHGGGKETDRCRPEFIRLDLEEAEAAAGEAEAAAGEAQRRVDEIREKLKIALNDGADAN